LAASLTNRAVAALIAPLARKDNALIAFPGLSLYIENRETLKKGNYLPVTGADGQQRMSTKTRKKRKPKSPQDHGCLSGCPFCIASALGIPKTGTRFRIISGFKVGEQGTVVKWPKDSTPIPNQFLAQLETESGQFRIILEEDLIQLLPALPPPSWAPPLGLQDAADLDSVVVNFCNKSFQDGEWVLDWLVFYEIVRTIWTKRLPIQSRELWAVLDAHGVPEKWRRKLSDFFTRGRDLLIYSAGKRPFKNKRVEPLSP
jgi:hypothetical protein